MAFINRPVKSIPASAALGGAALRQIEESSKTNQVMPSPDIMVSRTTKGTFLALRNPSGGGGGGSAEIIEMTMNGDMYDPVSDALVTTSGDLVLLPQYLRPAFKPEAGCEIQPWYRGGDTLYCLALTTLGPNGEAYIDMNVDARRWSKGVTVCQNNETSKFWIPVVTP